jgi:hypothetical protein
VSRQDSTEPIEFEGQTGLTGLPWQTESTAWSFGSRATRLVSALKDSPNAPDRATANHNGVPTSGVQQIEVPDRRPKRIPAATFGKRGFAPLYQWEGVVDEVFADRFTARLVPFEWRAPNRSKTEFTDFEFEDLSDPSDIDLVAPGAVFYWTIGRCKNEAGTITNTSLVRFRRLPSPGVYQQRQAEKEAESLLRGFGEPSSS